MTGYPDFSKAAGRPGGMLNHALDAMVMACDLPQITYLEGRNLQPGLIPWWVSRVRNMAPPPGPDGIPIMPEPLHVVEKFEDTFPEIS